MSEMRISSTGFRPDSRQKPSVPRVKQKKVGPKEEKPKKRSGIDRYA